MSTDRTPDAAAAVWRTAPRRYYPLGLYLRRRFGCRVRKVSVDAGFGCPNRDGTLGRGGCVFCDPAAFSPSRRAAADSITRQINRAAERLLRGGRGERLVAYFQPGTNTYAPVDRLRTAYEEALAHPAVAGVAIGTRPDCMGDDVLDLLAELATRTWLSVELGLQSIHERSLRWLGRGHDHEAFLDALRRGRGRGFLLGAHVILGLPGETRQDMAATAEELARLRIDSVKIHNLHAVRGTPLAQAVARGEVRLPSLEEHVACVVDFLERLHGECVIDRLTGQAPPEYLVGPDWCRDKSRVLAAIDAELARRDTWQGRLAQPVAQPPPAV